MTKEEEILLKTFFKFLKENDALEQYKVNAINGILCETKQIANALMPFKTIKDKFYILCLCGIMPTEKINHKTFFNSIINHSFAWSDTPQGFNYWSQLSAKWQIYFHSIELAKFQK